MSLTTSEIEVELLRVQVLELQRDIVRWRNAHSIVMSERDHYKALAELNSDTIHKMHAAMSKSQQKRVDAMHGKPLGKTEVTK